MGRGRRRANHGDDGGIVGGSPTGLDAAEDGVDQRSGGALRRNLGDGDGCERARLNRDRSAFYSRRGVPDRTGPLSCVCVPAWKP
jgi:hypothetical protein